MYRSKKLINILSRLGQAEAYDFSLEQETAQAKAISDTSFNITPRIVVVDANKVFHLEWDNLAM